MKTSDMIRQLCEQMNISVSELARRLGQSPQNFGFTKSFAKLFLSVEIQVMLL